MRIPGLDLLRAFAIVWVMFFHAQIMSFGTPWRDGTRFGWMGVDLFFVLSGYLIGRQWLTSLRDGEASFVDFYRRRAFRIFPAYAVVVAVYFLWPSLREQPAIQPFWQFATFTENLFITLDAPKSFTHVWSLCVEEHFYVAFPLVTLLLWSRRSFQLTVTVLVGVLAFGMLYRANAWFSHVVTAEEDGVAYFETIYYPTLPRLDGLLAGVALALVEVFRPEWWRRAMSNTRLALALGVVLLAASFALFDGDRSASSTIVGYPLVALAMACFVAAAASPAAWIQRAPLPGVAWLASVSYSLYLSHKLAFHAADQLGFGHFLGLSAAALLAGTALHFGVERPFLKLRDARLVRRVMPVA